MDVFILFNHYCSPSFVIKFLYSGRVFHLSIKFCLSKITIKFCLELVKRFNLYVLSVQKYFTQTFNHVLPHQQKCSTQPPITSKVLHTQLCD